MLKYMMFFKEHEKIEKKYKDLLDRMSLANTQAYASSKSQKGIDKKKSTKGNTTTRMISIVKVNARIKSLQSNGYNVYMYLDDELVDAGHLCCLAHARAKFKYAYE